MFSLIKKYPEAFIAYLIALSISGLLNFYPMEVKTNPVKSCVWAFMEATGPFTFEKNYHAVPCHRLTAREAYFFGDDI